MAGSAALKAVLVAAGKGINAISNEFARQVSEDRSENFLSSLDKELDAAIAVLGNDAPGALPSIKAAGQGLISRPEIFSDEAACNWIRTEKAQVHLKRALLALIQGTDPHADAEAAVSHYDRMTEPDGHPAGQVVFAAAIDYLQLSLRRAFTLGEKTILTAVAGTHGRLDEMSETLGDIRARMGASQSMIHADLVDPHVEWEIERLRRSRFFQSVDTRSRAIELARKLEGERFSGASASVRARALAWCARWLSQEDAEAAQARLAASTALAATAEARIAAAFIDARRDWKGSLRALDPAATPLDSTAFLLIIRRGLESAAETIDYFKAAGLSAENLDAEGRLILIITLIEAGLWDEAYAEVRGLRESDYNDAPSLFWMATIALIASRLPEDLRAVIRGGIPFDPAAFPLPEDKVSLDRRRLASQLMGRLGSVCRDLELPEEVASAERYKLWLDLRDGETRPLALEALKERLRDPHQALRHMQLGLAFELPIDLDEADDTIDKYLLLNPDGDPEAATARLAVAMARSLQDPAAGARHISEHQPQMSKHIDVAQLEAMEIELLIKAGDWENARSRLESLKHADVRAGVIDFFEDLIAAGADGPSVNDLEKLYAASPSTALRQALVQRYQQTGYSDRYFELVRELVQDTREASDVDRAINVLMGAGRYDEAMLLLQSVPDLVETSPSLRSAQAWLHYSAGRLDDAERVLENLEGERDDAGDRTLRFNLLVTSGRWPELVGFLEREWAKRENRSAEELAGMADLAVHLRSDRVRDIILAAVAKSPEDPRILASAYLSATSAGIEEQLEEARDWIPKAATLSDRGGPIQIGSIEDIIARQPQWESHVEDVNAKFAAGDIPISTAASALNRPWLEHQLNPMLSNLEERDPRRRSLVPLFSGAHVAAPGNLCSPAQPVGIDRTALITLASINLLDRVLDFFGEVRIPHSTLEWLFEEKRRIVFHQPSRIKFSQILAGLVDKGYVQPFVPDTRPDSWLIDNVGSSLASMLATASAAADGQHIVVHPFPVTRVGSLMRETVDLGAFSGTICGASAVVDKLEKSGALTVPQLARARAYLEVHEQRWPNAPEIEDGATLYLSDLSVDHLRAVDILDKISGAGLKVFISQHEIEEFRTFLQHATLTDKAVGRINSIAEALSKAISAGRVQLDRQIRRDLDEPRDPTLAIAKLAESVPAFVCDDRFMNRYTSFTHDSGWAFIRTTLDIIETMEADGRLTTAEKWEALSELRQMGALFVPVTAAELIHYFEAVGSGLWESAELRAIRENIRLIQQRGWWQPAVETPWLMALNDALATALVASWNDNVTNEVARWRSNWLLRLMDVRAWASSGEPKPNAELIENGFALMLSKVTVAAGSLSGASRERFAAWFDEEVISVLSVSHPAQHDWFLTHLRKMLLSLNDMPGIEDHPTLGGTESIALVLQRWPSFLQLAVAADPAFRALVPLEIGGSVSIGNGQATFDRDLFFGAVRACLAQPDRTEMLADESGNEWTVADATTDDGVTTLRMSSNSSDFRVRGLYGLHPDPSVRLSNFDLALDEAGLLSTKLPGWRARLSEAPLNDFEIDELNSDVGATPLSVGRAIADSIEHGTTDITLLIPGSRTYFEHLIGDMSAETRDMFALITAAAKVEELLAWDQEKGARLALLLASHQSTLAEGALAALDRDLFAGLGRWVLKNGDPLAMAGFAELAIARPDFDGQLADITTQLIKLILELDPADPQGRLTYLASLVALTDGELSRTRILADVPPFLRRAAAFAHAALIYRHTFGKIDAKSFSEWAFGARGQRFVLQSLADLRLEPRWLPSFLDPEQLRNELLGRLAGLADKRASVKTEYPELYDLLLGDEPHGVRHQIVYPMAFWPGPLEGAEAEDLHPMPDEVAQLLDEKLGMESFAAENLNAFINLRGLFKNDPAVIERAVKRISEAGYALIEAKPTDEAHALLSGLASVAACYRRPDLADQVALLVRRHRAVAEPRERLDLTSEVQIALTAAAAHDSMDDWAGFLKPWAYDLAIRADNREAATELQGLLDTMCDIVPSLRMSLGHALAALNLFLGE